MNKEDLLDIICQSQSDYDILNNAYNYIEELEQSLEKIRDYIINSNFYYEDDNCELFNPILKIVNKYHFARLDRDPSTWIKLSKKDNENDK